jgi:hypothetical protein
MKNSLRASASFPVTTIPRSAKRLSFGSGLAAMLFSAASLALNLTGTLTGTAESPPNASPGIGNSIVAYDAVTHVLTVTVNFSGLVTPTTMAHIHCCTAVPNTGTVGVATQVPAFAGFPLGVTAGNYQGSFDLTQLGSWNPAFVTANGGTPASAEAVLVAGLLSNSAYLNIHTSGIPSGEIRAFLTPLVAGNVPALGIAGMVVLGAGLAFGAFLFLRRRNARSAT